MSNFTVRDGSASIRLSTREIFVGSTAEGTYPPASRAYSQFAFTPKRGENGTLIFLSTVTNSKQLCFYQFCWDGDKLVMSYHLKRVERLYSYDETLGLCVQEGSVMYVTYNPQPSEPMYRQVDPITLVKYLEGKIDLQTLNKSALHQRLEQNKKTSLEAQNRQLRTRVRELELYNDNLVMRVQEMINVAQAYMVDAVNLRSLVQKFPKRLMKFVARKSPTLQAAVDKTYAHEAPDLHLVHARTSA